MGNPGRPARLLANAIIKAMFYIPKGIIYPVAIFIDFVKAVRLHSNIACAFCEGSDFLAPKPKMRYFQRIFLNLQNSLYPLFFHFARLLLWIVNVAVPSKILAWCQPYLQKLWKKRHFLKQHRDKIVWKYILPLGALMLMPYFFGLGIIPEIYIFFLASSWAGKILNFSANLLVRRGNSAEWGFIKSVLLVLFKKRTLARLYNDYRESLQAFGRELCFDLVVIGLLQRASMFAANCFQAFFSWLLLYILVKTTADEAPAMLLTLEEYLTEKQQEEPHSFKHQLGNGLWIALYYTFQETSSSVAQNHYQGLHQTSHNAPILLDCAQRQGSNLNSSQSRLRG